MTCLSCDKEGKAAPKKITLWEIYLLLEMATEKGLFSFLFVFIVLCVYKQNAAIFRASEIALIFQPNPPFESKF